jgi:hypothetical protein
MIKAPAGTKSVLTGERSGLNERVKRFTAPPQKQRLLPPAAMTNERKMENIDATRKT